MPMRVIAFLAIFAAVGPAAAFGHTWRGFLVDGRCYAALERNHNPTDTSTAVDQDKGQMIRYCRPGSKTKSFALVEEDGSVDQLDAAGDGKAAGFASKVKEGSPLRVTVTGERQGNTIKVD